MLLRKGDVVDGALELLDAEGLDGFTTRKLGAVLGVRAGALYRHYPTKQALLEAMGDRILDDVTADLPSGPWQQRATALAHRMREALLAHRDGAGVVAGSYVTEPNTVALGNAVVGLLQTAGLRTERAAWAAAAISYYVLGHSIEEQARAEMLEGGSWQQKMNVSEQMSDRLVVAAFDADPAERFSYGLRLLLNGIGQEVAGG